MIKHLDCAPSFPWQAAFTFQPPDDAEVRSRYFSYLDNSTVFPSR